MHELCISDAEPGACPRCRILKANPELSLMRQITFSLALVAAIFAAPYCSAQPRATASQGFPGRPMPPDMNAPPDTRPANAPKPERGAMPQSDQPAKVATHPSAAATPHSVQPTQPDVMHK